MKFVSFFICMTFASVLSASTPSRVSCRYYLEAEKEYLCGSNGYLLKFGHRLCEKYRVAEAEMPSNVKTWFPKVRYCLQKYIEDQRGSIRDCQDLKKKALDSHIGCYKNTGFCNLSFSDKLQVIQATSWDVINPNVISLSLRVSQICE